MENFQNRPVRVRFAPSPTGALHIGGVRTALYNYLFAKKHGGQFLLRIEDTDQGRYVEGAENYIIESLKWAGIVPDEGVGFGGPLGPYRQSDRKDIYRTFALQLVELGHAYFAFDTPEELEALRSATENFTVNFQTRHLLKTSLTLPKNETDRLLSENMPSVIRLKVPENQTVIIEDLIRGRVEIQTNELDDKVLLKADGMPTYHLANIVDDHLMQISHVIRGEEWLPSTAHHVLLYRSFGWEKTMPQFAHLPLILKPVGNGKLSKRDGAKFGMPVFPLGWADETAEDSFDGFRETGFLPAAMLNFLALLGWHPGGDQEIFSLEQLISAFEISQISKSGARFDYEKAKWFNQKYLQALPNEQLAEQIKSMVEAKNWPADLPFLAEVVRLLKDRVTFLTDFVKEGAYFFEPPFEYDLDTVGKKWDAAKAAVFSRLVVELENLPENFTALETEETTKAFMAENGTKPGDLFPLLRIGLIRTNKGPAVFDLMSVFGKAESLARLRRAATVFNENLT